MYRILAIAALTLPALTIGCKSDDDHRRADRDPQYRDVYGSDRQDHYDSTDYYHDPDGRQNHDSRYR